MSLRHAFSCTCVEVLFTDTFLKCRFRWKVEIISTFSLQTNVSFFLNQSFLCIHVNEVSHYNMTYSQFTNYWFSLSASNLLTWQTIFFNLTQKYLISIRFLLWNTYFKEKKHLLKLIPISYCNCSSWVMGVGGQNCPH